MSDSLVEKQMRKGVVFVCTQMEAGGVQVLATSMAEYLIKEGIEAKVVFIYCKRAIFGGSKNIDILFPSKPTPFESVKICLRLIRYVRQHKPTAIIGMAHYSSPLAALVGLLTGVPCRIATQTSQPERLSKFARVLDWTCGTSKIYTSNIAASKHIERAFDYFPRSYRSKLKTIYNGVTVQSTSLTKVEARSQFGLASNAFLLVTCGRLAAVKNHELLLKIVQRMPNVHLAILGEGELRAELTASIAVKSIGERVTLLGELPPSSVTNFLRAGDVFVFPSHSEAFGMAVVEAMMAGLPVIASNCPAVAEVVGDAGLLVDPLDVDGWVGAVERYYSESELRETAATSSAVRASKFSFDKMARAFRDEIFGTDLV